MKIRIAHSPDPDDAFMFYALFNGKLNTRGLELESVLGDIETLNREAENGTYEITAISFHNYVYVSKRYRLLSVGASMGFGYGPIMVAKEGGNTDLSSYQPIAVPGTKTSAYLILKLHSPEIETTVLPFDQILDKVVRGEVGAGLLIHEGQITYSAHGLRKLIDLGDWWFNKYSFPLPLGANVVRRDVDEGIAREAARLIRESINWALAHREDVVKESLKFGRGIDRFQCDQFVSMYVNDLTLDLGDTGRNSVMLFLGDAHKAGLIPELPPFDFLQV